MSSKKLNFPATERNRVPILNVLKEVISKHFPSKEKLEVLEIASGSGQHSVYFAQNLPNLSIRPTDVDNQNLQSIKAYVDEVKLKNLKTPLLIDITNVSFNFYIHF